MTGVQVLISVRVHPGAPRNELVACREGVWHVKVAAPRMKGKANAELVEFLSNVLGLSKSSLAVLRGQTSPRKIVQITGLSQDEVLRRLSGSASSGGGSTR